MKVFQIVVSESDLLSRCVKCNGEFTPRPLTSAEAKTQAPAAQEVPKSVLETCEEYWQCCVCGHLFWQVSSLCPYRQRHQYLQIECRRDVFRNFKLKGVLILLPILWRYFLKPLTWETSSEPVIKDQLCLKIGSCKQVAGSEGELKCHILALPRLPFSWGFMCLRTSTLNSVDCSPEQDALSS
jgi:hypothetical protein